MGERSGDTMPDSKMKEQLGYIIASVNRELEGLESVHVQRGTITAHECHARSHAQSDRPEHVQADITIP